MEDVIEKFIKSKKIGLVGVSRSREKWGNMLFRALKKKGYTVYPINPNAKEIMAEKCYPNVAGLPKDVESIILSVPDNVTDQIVKECSEAGIKRVWMHKGAGSIGSQTKEALKYCKEKGIEVVYDLCPMMFFPPAGIHRLHFMFKKMFNKLPEEYRRV